MPQSTRRSNSAMASAETTIEDLHPDLVTHALRLLDGPSLAVASCSSSHLRRLSTNPHLWRDLCLSKWPSLHLLPSSPASHRSFFSDANPFPSLSHFPADVSAIDIPTSLVSAIDIYHRGVPIISRIVETDASTPWSQTSPFHIDALSNDDTPVADVAISPEELTLSWIIMVPTRQRAVNVSSRVAITMDRHWYTGDTLVRFATVVGSGTDRECVVGMAVACGEEGRVREVSLTVEDMDGACLSGRESLIVLKGLMDGRRTVKEGEVESGRRYAEHLGRRRRQKERKLRREVLLDLCCSVILVTLFSGLWCRWFTGI